MNKTLAKNQNVKSVKKPLKVKTEKPLGFEDESNEPKKRGRKSVAEKISNAALDENYEKVMNILDAQSGKLIAEDKVKLNMEDGKDTIIAKGKNQRVNVGKFWCQFRDNVFSVHETQTIRKSIWEKSWTPKEDNAYNEMCVYLSEHAF